MKIVVLGVIAILIVVGLTGCNKSSSLDNTAFCADVGQIGLQVDDALYRKLLIDDPYLTPPRDSEAQAASDLEVAYALDEGYWPLAQSYYSTYC